ncbi:MAG TPA: CvpA family protein [Chthoniobacterales bacterium]
MNTFVTSTLIIAALPILIGMWRGWRHGATLELRYTLAISFGILLTLRYWEPLTGMLSQAMNFDARWLAVGAAVVLFSLGFALAGFVVRIKAEAFPEAQSDPVNQVLGAVSGLFSGALLASGIIWVSAVAMPGALDSIEIARAFEGFSQTLADRIESAVGMDATSAARIHFPEVKLVQAPADSASPAAGSGVVIVHQVGQISWR